MNCRCGYEGDPEWGTFPTNAFQHFHMRCPKCKSSLTIVMMPWERIEMALRFPEFCTGSVDYGPHELVQKEVYLDRRGTYSVCCPKCMWGDGGGFIPEPYLSHLLGMIGWKEFPEVKFP